ncbi:MAG: hypothetical protein LUD81_11370 [Clostridiales bacterium]|nr:hypothetical protein [Clostridiales bacterium]
MKIIKDNLIFIVLLLVFQVIAFVPPFVHNTTFWFSYIFGCVSILTAMVYIKYAYRNSETLKSRFYNFPVVYVCGMYVLCQLILSIVFMALASKTYSWIGIILFAVMLGFVIIVCYSVTEAVPVIESIDVKSKQNVQFMKTTGAEIKAIRLSCEKPAIKSELAKLEELIRYSDPVSDPSLFDIENRIDELCKQLESEVDNKDEKQVLATIFQLKKTVEKRNILCKAAK